MKARKWSLGISVIADDAVSAAERLKNVAPGASPGYRTPA